MRTRGKIELYFVFLLRNRTFAHTKRQNFLIMAQSITSQNFDELVATGKPIVLDFWATWCGPCKKLGTAIDELANIYEGQAIVGKCDVEEDEELTSRFGIRNVPTVLFIKNGEVIDKSMGAVPQSTLEEKLKQML